MKKIIISILACCPVLAFAQTGNFTLSGQINNADKAAKAFLIYKAKTDSVTLNDGKFVFNGQLDEPAMATLLISHKGKGLNASKKNGDRLNFYLEGKTLQLTPVDSIAKSKVLNSIINDENNELSKMLAENSAKFSKTYNSYLALPNEEKESPKYQTELQKQFGKIEDEKKEIQAAFIKAHPNSIISLSALKDYAGMVPDGDATLAVFAFLSKDIRESAAGKKFEEVLKTAAKLGIGKMAPDFSAPDTADKSVSLSSYKGKYVLVDFWASWCVPCRAENPNLVKSYNRFHQKGLEVLGVSLDQKKENWVKAIQEDGLTWAHVSDLKYWKSDIAKLYQVNAVPQNYLIGPDGKIIAKNLRGEALNVKLAEILGNN
ncbi:TlpA disulfide reductase family protein [Pedobacter sp. UBA5917]|jgi:peroxiredoxin|uniref:TlpA disulfide reductase family protein n=1 Tax=Pedobacter sp. UBA5917 TaxID=1947061 RepID=UPI0025E47017|nr:TlpA disulfide reductase family protein [Pedobacter sp. UBA5917]